MKITVNKIPPSNNLFMGNSHSFRKYGKLKKEWELLIQSAVKNKPKKPFERAVVKITYFFPDDRRRDPDNYSGKMILDPLVRLKIIADDSFKAIGLELYAKVDKIKPRTEIEVIEDI